MESAEDRSLRPTDSERAGGLPRWRWFDLHVGVLPLPIYVLLGLLLVSFVALGWFPGDVTIVIVTLAFLGSTCAEIGKRVPILRSLGGPVIVATFAPSYLVHRGLLPQPLLQSIVDFSHSTDFIYLFIACVIVGSILGMERSALTKGFLRILAPLSAGTVLAAIAGTLTGGALGLGFERAFFFCVVPVMAGGVGEGAIPLSVGYAALLHRDQGEVFAEVLPMVMLGSVTAVVLAGVLDTIGRKRPRFSGGGKLSLDEHDPLASSVRDRADSVFDAPRLASASIFAAALFVLGSLCQRLVGLPAPVAMLFAALTIKLLRAMPPRYEDSAYMVYRFFATGVTYPLLFAVGASMTPWTTLVTAFVAPTLITIIVTVSVLVGTGFFLARRLRMYPVECALVNACHGGQGGTGSIAILTAASRMNLMPFAQISSRIGGAATVTLALVVLRLTT